MYSIIKKYSFHLNTTYPFFVEINPGFGFEGYLIKLFALLIYARLYAFIVHSMRSDYLFRIRNIMGLNYAKLMRHYSHRRRD
ncbi:hypothetical protein DSCO28_08310 [Desulfosarcina ovata subsp. sediminis]|uniref:Uncharacterized protein n=1 Tax=Desulfosarcina ovata subsp. sediminis TaxID=885957 RepID=A0A5K7ZJ79_9BACT|nr:hypothetical protein DSCO28_08310 [Desulfosarcina ovata subsp. sediminis]